MSDSRTTMSDWVCQFCGNFVRQRAHRPSYCPKCSVGTFRQVADSSLPSSENVPAGPSMPALLSAPPSTPLPDLEPRNGSKPQHLTTAPEAPEPHQRRQPAKRVRPKKPLEVRLARTPSLEALDISATGLLVEYARPFPPGSICEVELWRSSLGIRLQAEVVRSVVSGGGKGSQTGMRYRTAVHFLETPQTIFTLLPELSETP